MEGVSVQPSAPQPPLKEASSLINSKNLLLLLLVALIVGAVVFVLISSQTVKEPTVSLTKEYENPFDKKTQYINPFSDYKNPFDNLTK